MSASEEFPVPAVALLRPMTFAKEQAPTEYTRRLADAGYAALAFDPRYRGESGGDPRCLESPFSKVEDVRAAVTFLSSQGAIDPACMFLLGICQGSCEILGAALDDDRVVAVATVSRHDRDEEGDLEWLTAAGRAERLERGDAAKGRFSKMASSSTSLRATRREPMLECRENSSGLGIMAAPIAALGKTGMPL